MATLQATITNIIQDPDATVVEVTYSDNVSQKFQKEYRFASFDLNNFKNIVQSQINQFISAVNAKDVISIGPFDPTIISPPLTPKQIFAQNLVTLLHMEKAITEGFKTAQDQDYSDLKSAMIKAWDSTYVDLF